MFGLKRMIGRLDRPQKLLKYEGKHYVLQDHGQRLESPGEPVCQFDGCEPQELVPQKTMFFRFIYIEYKQDYFGFWHKTANKLPSNEALKMERVK